MIFVLLDEAGSIALAAKTGRYMYIVAVITRHPQRLARAIKVVKKRFRVRGEFSASRQEPRVVKAVLESIADEDFKVVVLTIDKNLTASFRGDRELLYNHAVAQTLNLEGTSRHRNLDSSAAQRAVPARKN
jgi:fatty acid-binding protein DegV